MIPVCAPSTTQKEIKWVNKALKENKISSTGGFVEQFEKEFAKKAGTEYAVAVNSGTSALLLALKALGIKEGDEVIMPTFTMISTANAVSQAGATPVFIDSEPDTGNIDVTLIEEKITPRTKAIIPVHLYGHICDMREIWDISDRYGLKVVEDAAEAHGASYKRFTAGSMGDCGCFSFYANKIITTGEGGAVTTNNKELAEEIKLLRACYFYDKYHFWHRKPAFNMRMSSLEAAYGLGQLERWDELIGKRIKHAEYYNKKLQGIAEAQRPREKKDHKSVYWMYLISVPDRDELTAYLEKNGVETRTGFITCHRQPPYKQKGNYPVAEHFAESTLYLPSSSDLTKKQQDEVIKLIREYYA